MVSIFAFCVLDLRVLMLLLSTRRSAFLATITAARFNGSHVAYLDKLTGDYAEAFRILHCDLRRYGNDALLDLAGARVDDVVSMLASAMSC